MKLDLDAIERLAREATPGPWFTADWQDDFGADLTTVEAHAPEIVQPGSYRVWPDGVQHLRIADTAGGERPFSDAAYMAAANPATVLLMCKAIRAAQEAMALYHDGPLPTSIRALREALAPFDAQPEASTTGAGGQQ